MDDFQSLGKNSIRLLRIQPELRNGHIACIVHQFDEAIPPYDALSYHWGDPESGREKIYVNDSLVDIHKALWEFLDQMQRSQENENWIWTDFLCLNQKNHTEMGHQIPRMGHIYSSAERTISWLGCNDSCWASRRDGSSTHAEDLEEDMRLVAEKVDAEGAAIKNFFAQPKMPRWTDLTDLMSWAHRRARPTGPISGEGVVRADSGLPKTTMEVRLLSAGNIAQALLNILCLPYWTRAWICQEVALARKVMLVFGRERLHFDDFLLIYKGYCYHMLKACGSASVELKVPIEARIAVQENNAPFQQIVRWGRNCKASKTLDRIYGLLGLLERCSDGTHPLPTVLAEPIDYTRDSREVCWEIALTYHISDEFRISGDRYKVSMSQWLDYLDDLGRSLSCPLTRESLQYADNERATPLCRKKAQIALSVLDIYRQVVMADISIWIPDTRHRASTTSSWPTKTCARQLWSNPPFLEDTFGSPYTYIQLPLGTLFIETAAFEGMDDDDKYQAAVIGMTMFMDERREGVWSCMAHQSMEEPLEHNIEFRIACKIGTASLQLPCSSLSTTSSTESLRKSHQCLTSDRYLVIERTGWRLSLKLGDLRKTRGEAYCEGTLHVEY